MREKQTQSLLNLKRDLLANPVINMKMNKNRIQEKLGKSRSVVKKLTESKSQETPFMAKRAQS